MQLARGGFPHYDYCLLKRGGSVELVAIGPGTSTTAAALS